MAGPLDLRGRVTIVDNATPTLKKIEHALASIGRQTGRKSGFSAHLGGSARGAPAGSLGFGMTAFGFTALIGATKEWNDALWGTNAALLANEDVQARVAAGDMPGAIRLAATQTAQMSEEAVRLSRELNLLPELFAKAGMEATKMGLDYQKSLALMRAAGAVFMSDNEADPQDITKALGTYGLLYGQEEDPQAYAKQVYERASMLAYAGGKTRTSASKIEAGARNYMGIHGAFGGRFEDLIALIATGSQAGQFERVTGTSQKSLLARFMRMPPGGYAAMAAAGINLKEFMDFGAVDPTRATNAIIQAFPQQLGTGARGNLFKFLETAQREGRLGNPEIISETMAELERNGLKFSGDEDRDAAFQKLGALMHGAGGNFDPIAMFASVQRAIEEGRATPAIMSAIGEPRRIHEYLAILKLFPEMLRLRDELIADDGKYLSSVEKAFPESAAGRIAAMTGAFQRLQIAIMSNEGLFTFISGLERVFDWASKLPPELVTIALAAVTGRAALGGLVWIFGGALRAVTGLLGGLARLRGALALFSGFSAAAAAGAPLLGFLTRLAGAATNAAKGLGRVGKLGGLWGGAKALGKVGLRFLPGVGWVIAAGAAGYAGYQAWQRGEDAAGIAKDTALGAIGLDGDETATTEGHGAPYQPDSGAPMFDADDLAASVAEAERGAGRLRAALTLDLTAEGRRMGETLAQGILQSIPGAVSAASSLAARARAAASGPIQLNTGPNMRPAR